MAVGLGLAGLFLFVPETFWDRTPTRKPSNRPSFLRRLSSHYGVQKRTTITGIPDTPGRHRESGLHTPRPVKNTIADLDENKDIAERKPSMATSNPHSILSLPHAHHKTQHVGFSDLENTKSGHSNEPNIPKISISSDQGMQRVIPAIHLPDDTHPETPPLTPGLHERYPSNSLQVQRSASPGHDYFSHSPGLETGAMSMESFRHPPKSQAYTHNLRQQPAKSFVQQLQPYHGRLNTDKWLKVMIRPFVLYAYPAVLWSALVYSCSIGWLIVISENLAVIYRSPKTYNFSALQAGLVYVSPFIGGILGTGVAGKISDIIVKAMARRNGGLYEPEFRLVMAAPIAVTTIIGLMGFGWSAQEHDAWIVPTLFFGLVSFGCALGSTTSITFCVDSYRQYAGEALVTLNFMKNICHGLVFSLFISQWLSREGSKKVYIWIGVIQLVVISLSIPMYIFGKRLRMWTVRRNLMERF